ncbi:hypothetical protein AVM02_10480 [Brucella anthropi]|uniref:tripartite tricarboxylate transporter TctB family protein n=1 Tax=Brucella anthropi TaxID=529 RepID=UPI0039859715
MMKRFTFSTWLTVVMLLFFAVAITLAMGYPAKARMMPLIVAIPGVALCLIQLAVDLLSSPKSTFHGAPRAGLDHPVGVDVAVPAVEELPEFGPHTVRQELVMWAFFVAFIVCILLFGYYVSVPALLLIFLRQQARVSWRLAISLAVGATLVLYLAFAMLLHIQLHPGFLTPLLMAKFGFAAA